MNNNEFTTWDDETRDKFVNDMSNEFGISKDIVQGITSHITSDFLKTKPDDLFGERVISDGSKTGEFGNSITGLISDIVRSKLGESEASKFEESMGGSAFAFTNLDSKFANLEGVSQTLEQFFSAQYVADKEQYLGDGNFRVFGSALHNASDNGFVKLTVKNSDGEDVEISVPANSIIQGTDRGSHEQDKTFNVQNNISGGEFVVTGSVPLSSLSIDQRKNLGYKTDMSASDMKSILVPINKKTIKVHDSMSDQYRANNTDLYMKARAQAIADGNEDLARKYYNKAVIYQSPVLSQNINSVDAARTQPNYNANLNIELVDQATGAPYNTNVQYSLKESPNGGWDVTIPNGIHEGEIEFNVPTPEGILDADDLNLYLAQEIEKRTFSEYGGTQTVESALKDVQFDANAAMSLYNGKIESIRRNNPNMSEAQINSLISTNPELLSLRQKALELQKKFVEMQKSAGIR